MSYWDKKENNRYKNNVMIWKTVKKLPKNGQRVWAKYQGVYEPRICTFWIDQGGASHFGLPNESDGKGSQPATHWMPVEE